MDYHARHAIIDEETWQTAHRIRESGRRRKVEAHDKGPLNGLLYCETCGNKLYFKPTPRLKSHHGCYMCGYYLHYKLCSTHYIRRDDLEAVVLAQLRKITELTTEIAATLIEKVLVGQTEKVDGQQQQKVRIIYNFIGDVSE